MYMYMYIILFPSLCCNTIEILLSKLCLTERNCNCNRNEMYVYNLRLENEREREKRE